MVTASEGSHEKSIGLNRRKRWFCGFGPDRHRHLHGGQFDCCPGPGHSERAVTGTHRCYATLPSGRPRLEHTDLGARPESSMCGDLQITLEDGPVSSQDVERHHSANADRRHRVGARHRAQRRG